MSRRHPSTTHCICCLQSLTGAGPGVRKLHVGNYCGVTCLAAHATLTPTGLEFWRDMRWRLDRG